VTTLRERLCEPPPHVVLHSVHSTNEPTTQCTGQGARLQSLTSLTAPQAPPPLAAAVTTVRERVCVPASQLTEQSPQDVNSVRTQSTGQGSELHACDSDRNGQATPPWLTLRVTARERLCEPPPHVVVHSVHACHVSTTQSTGQCCMLQPVESPRGGQETPPNAAGVATVRLRDMEPPPQVVVQSLHGIHPDRTQSTGHESVWHDCVCSRKGHTTPPFSAWCTIVRERLCEPPPHVFEHALHDEKSDTTQCSGHMPLLHVCDSLS
jgi:hypothetical protein